MCDWYSMNSLWERVPFAPVEVRELHGLTLGLRRTHVEAGDEMVPSAGIVEQRTGYLIPGAGGNDVLCSDQWAWREAERVLAAVVEKHGPDGPLRFVEKVLAAREELANAHA